MKDRLVCSCLKVSLQDIRNAQIEQRAKTISDIKKLTKAGTICCTCLPDIEHILDTVCDCNGVSVSEIKSAITNGASSLDEIGKQTTAGTRCGSCKPLIKRLLNKDK